METVSTPKNPDTETTIMLQLSNELKAKAREAAARDRRSLNSWLRLVIEKATEEQNG